MALMSNVSATLTSAKLVVTRLCILAFLLLVRGPFEFRQMVQHFFTIAIARSFFIHSPCLEAIVKMALSGGETIVDVAATCAEKMKGRFKTVVGHSDWSFLRKSGPE